jgi:hypothetical protein
MTLRTFVSVALLQCGLISGLLGIGLLVLVSLSPLGLVDAYPTPPVHQSAAPWAQTRPLEDSSELDKRDGENDAAYFYRLAKMSSASIEHWWPIDDPARSRYTRVTLLSNYLLWSMSKLARWGNFQDIEFMSPDEIVERGFGVCSQASRLVAAVLHRNGYDPVIYEHEHHVVVQVNGVIIDGDYGVFIPHSVDYLKEHSYLLPFFYSNFKDALPLLVSIYEGGFNPHADMGRLFGQMRFEEKMRTFKWLPPPILLAISFFSSLLARRLAQPSISRHVALDSRILTRATIR